MHMHRPIANVNKIIQKKMTKHKAKSYIMQGIYFVMVML